MVARLCYKFLESSTNGIRFIYNLHIEYLSPGSHKVNLVYSYNRNYYRKIVDAFRQ